MKRKYHSWAEVMDLREVKSLKKVIKIERFKSSFSLLTQFLSLMCK